MKGQFIITVLLLWSISNTAIAQSPYWQWARSEAPNSNGIVTSITTDVNGNIYSTGYFGSPSITFGGYTLTNASDTANIFIVKYDSSGTVIWAESFGGTGNDESYSIYTDINGNLYLTGSFTSDTIIFGEDTLMNNSRLTNATRFGMGGNVFLAKCDSSGSVTWARNMGGHGDNIGYSIYADILGNIYVTGGYTDTMIIGSDTLNNSRDDFDDIFIAKYDSTGRIIWAKGFGGYDGAIGANICTDTKENIYLAGDYSDYLYIENDTLAGLGAMFVAKFDLSGNIIWTNHSDETNGSEAFPNAIGVDLNGNIYATGYFQDSIFFGSDTLSFYGGQHYEATYSSFCLKYDSSGNKIWVKGFAPYARAGNIDINGNTYLTGAFYGWGLFGGDTLMSVDTEDIFIVKYDASGVLNWAISAVGNGYNYPSAICTDAIGNIYVFGQSADTLLFGNDTDNGGNIFVAKLGTTTTGINHITPPTQHLTIYPNPAQNQATIEWQPTGEATGYLTIYDLLGRQIHDQQVDGASGQALLNTSMLDDGLYVVKLYLGNGGVMSGKLAVGR